MYNKLFENLEAKEQNAVKFAFELVGKFTSCRASLVKLTANGTTGYPVYYLYISNKNQGYVLRIIKQGRKCKLMPFGNPKLIWVFVNDTNSKAPTRKESTVECFTKIFESDIMSAKQVIAWVNKKIDSNITLQDFNVSERNTNMTLNNNVSNSSPATSKESKKDLIISLISKELSEAKKSKSTYKQSYITINVYQFMRKYISELKPYYPKGSDYYEELEDDFYSLGIYLKWFPGFITKYELIKPWGWFNNERKTHIESISYIAKPCKEFESLNNYITNTLKCNALKTDDIMYQNVEGKRSTIFNRYNTELLAHNPEKCKKIKAELQKMKKQNWHAEISLKTDTYWGDRFNSYGEDRESEWDGSETQYAKVTFKTPSGKIADEYYIRP